MDEPALPRPTALRVAAATLGRAVLSLDEAVDQLCARLVPSVVDAAEIRLTDEPDAVRRSVAGDVAGLVADLEARLARAPRGGRTGGVNIDVESNVIVMSLFEGDTALGSLVLAVGESSAPFGPADAEAAVELAQLLSAVAGRAALQRRARDAARRSQRIASQLHQLLAAAIAVAGLQQEGDVLEALASRARGVFDAEEALVSLDEGPGAHLEVVVRRPSTTGGGAPSTAGPPSLVPAALRASDVPVQAGEWLVAPLAVRRAARGRIAIRRREGATFSDDDVEVASLLAQTASSALEATELHRTIVQSEARLRVLVDTAPIGIVETDPEDGSIRWWNHAAASLFGWPDVGSGPGAPRFPAAALAPLEELWATARGGGAVASHDLSGVELAGHRRELAASVALVAPTDGRGGSLLTVVEDVTDHRQLMEELRHAQRMDVIGQLSSSVAHDFNNLLTLIAGYAELLVLEARDQPRTVQLARDIQATTTRASTLTGKLLTMGRTKLPEPVVFSPVASVGGLSEVLDRILGKEVALELALDDGAGTVRADPDQFEQMVMNLATNARDAMGEGGTLRISISPRTLAGADAAALGLAPGEFVEVLVADTGAGMDDETLRRCFEPLYTTKGPSKGTGLGLPAARRVVTESGGAIEVRSALGAGTTFEIVLPVVVAAPVAPEVAPEPAPAPTGGTVLLTEDEDGIRELIGRILRHNGFDVLEAESAERALEISDAYDEPIDLLVSDVVLGGMTGGELAARLQAGRPGLLVVLVSGNVDATVVEGLAPGTGAFLAKPFKPSELLEVIVGLRGAAEAGGG